MYLRTSARNCSNETDSRCCVDKTTASIRIGLSFSSSSTVTWALASGNKYDNSPERRTSACFLTNLCDKTTDNGKYSSVSFVAKPNIKPWSPAPIWSNGSTPPSSRCSIAESTPCAMSGDCSSNVTPTWISSAKKPASLSS